mmetsp:Transcript_57250/g.100268  ORF Transcript_57250/g.100268 Transcript_57250/m.100268 type:complete len:160 (+) Transcript_57250:85-564(+)
MIALRLQMLSGRTVLEKVEVDPSDSVKSLVQLARKVLNGKQCDLVGPDGKKLRRYTPIDACNIADGDTLTLVMRSGPLPIPPESAQCPHPRSCLGRDVSVGAQHEGWGRKWNTCSYECMACEDSIEHGSSAVVCQRCKGFWHSGCEHAPAPELEACKLS